MENQASHPAPKRHHISPYQMTIALMGAPLAWFAQISLCQAIASNACYPHQTPLAEPRWPSLHYMIALVSAACLVGSIISLIVAYRAWRKVRDEKAHTGEVVEVGEGRTRFLAVFGIMISLIFFCAILFTELAQLLVSPCQKWF